MSHLRKKIFTELGIAAGILALLGAGVFFFSYNINTFAARLKENKKELQLRGSAIHRLAELERLEKRVALPYLTVLYNLIPKKDELINFSREAQGLASSEGLQFGFSFLGENPASPDTLGSVRFVINVSGESQTNIQNMLQKLQNFRFLTRVDDFSISGGEGSSQATIRGQVFFRL